MLAGCEGRPRDTWRVTAWHVTRAIPAKCCKSCQFVTIFIGDIPCIVIPAAIMLPWLIQIDCNSDSWLAHRHPGYINKYFQRIVWKSASLCIYCLATVSTYLLNCIIYIQYWLCTMQTSDTQLKIYVVRAGLKWALRGAGQGWAHQAHQAAVWHKKRKLRRKGKH